jgi:hypothetical protein
LSTTKDTAISAMAATLPTTGAATHAIDGEPVSGAVSSGTDSAEETGVVVGLGNTKGNVPAVRDEDEGGVMTRSVAAGFDVAGVRSGIDVVEGDGAAAPLLAPPGGVKNTAPPLTGAVCPGDGTGTVETPGPAGEESPAAGGAAAAATIMAESVRRSAATALESVTAVLR